MLADASQNISSGMLTEGIEPNSSIKSVVEFIEIHFTKFSKKVRGEITTSEKSLTDKLCKYFNRNAGNYPFYFHHENVENHASGISPQTDIGTLSEEEKLTVGDRSYGEFDSFFSIEAKRLPTPGQNREKEYVIGKDRPSGGIERFKKKIHGKNLKWAAVIGYIQKEDANHWFLKINDWIGELVASNPEFWKDDDKLIKLNTELNGLNKFISKNFRSEVDRQEDCINLFHFWISLTDEED